MLQMLARSQPFEFSENRRCPDLDLEVELVSRSVELTRGSKERTGVRKGLGFGPGVVFLLAVTGPRDLVTNSVAGASYGYATLWVLLVVVAARFFILEASGRYALATEESLLTGYARVGRWVNWLILLSLILKRHLANIYLVLFLGSVSQVLAPLPVRFGRAFWALFFCAIGFALMYWGRYRVVELFSKPAAVALGASMLAVALLSRPDPGAIAQGMFVPSVPPHQGVYSYAFLVMALAGSSAGSLSNLKYASFVREKGWRDISALPRLRVDLLLGVMGIFAMGALMQIAAAATLKPLGVQLKEVVDLLPLFSGALGPAGKIILSFGIWAIAFNTYLASNTGYSLMASDIYYGLIRPSAARALPAKAAASQAHRPAYRGWLVFFCVTPLYAFFTDWTPVGVTLLAASVEVVLLLLVVPVLWRLTADKKRMGRFANGWGTNAVMLLMVVMAVVLTCQNATQFWTAHIARLFK